MPRLAAVALDRQRPKVPVHRPKSPALTALYLPARCRCELWEKRPASSPLASRWHQTTRILVERYACAQLVHQTANRKVRFLPLHFFSTAKDHRPEAMMTVAVRPPLSFGMTPCGAAVSASGEDARPAWRVVAGKRLGFSQTKLKTGEINGENSQAAPATMAVLNASFENAELSDSISALSAAQSSRRTVWLGP